MWATPLPGATAVRALAFAISLSVSEPGMAKPGSAWNALRRVQLARARLQPARFRRFRLGKNLQWESFDEGQGELCRRFAR